MQEWVDTLRLKLREMKILSPKENLYSKLPELRPPLLPTRDPTRDPLPATPPVPAALVPGVEPIVNTPQTSRTTTLPLGATTSSTPSNSNPSNSQPSQSIASTAEASERNQNRRITPPLQNVIENENDEGSEDSFNVETANTTATSLSSTSNTLSQNLIKMLYPLPNFSHSTNDTIILPNDLEESFVSENSTPEIVNEPNNENETIAENVHSLARTFAANVLFDSNTSSSSKRTQNSTTNLLAPQSTAPSNINCDVSEGN